MPEADTHETVSSATMIIPPHPERSGGDTELSPARIANPDRLIWPAPHPASSLAVGGPPPQVLDAVAFMLYTNDYKIVSSS